MATKNIQGTLNVTETVKINSNDLMSNFAANYDSTATYAIGDLCSYQGKVYECSTDIAVAEAFDPTHWTEKKVSDLVGGAGPAPELCESITWEALKALRDGGNLVPGKWYRITDYTCTTVQSHTQSAGNVFDILIRADDASHLNENCFAAHHEGDTYFANCKLSAWRIWYCLDNNSNRFAWADTTNGKGVIYRMIDEFNNDCPYDFKNIKSYPDSESSPNYSYTFTVDVNSWYDASVYANSYANGHCVNNKIERYGGKQQEINKVRIFVKASNSEFKICDNHFGNSTNIYCSTSASYISNKFVNNYIGNDCKNISLRNFSSYNYIGNDCDTCTISGAYNKIGNGCAHIVILYSYSGYGTNRNTIEDSCQYISISQCCDVRFETQCEYITIGTDNSYTTYCKGISFDLGCKYLFLTTNDSGSTLLKNITVHKGVYGDSSTNRLTLTVSRGLNYETEFKPAGSVITEVSL